ncbi:hypothetical protein [Azospirillum sp. TSO35-2]|uniref:hypothetical protein n=1 Tax=Azospirillum sp. TSO35-2 TaxID=716796 RepID=UPI000D61B11E|nr:hypothetical protein [Azospirillum sp. TSO35-2]PWC39528.1 hypothetical protein TSO352_05165 [Azospirillum sp. TSO35-2]
MRVVVAGCVVSVGIALSGCSATGPAPLNVGSLNGNYAAEMEGEMRGPAGERCFVFTWDRPLTAELVVRLRSASCESREHPNWMTSTELSRTVVPVAQSALKESGLTAGVR